MYPIYVGETHEQARREVIEHWHRCCAFAMDAQNLTPEKPAYQRVFRHLDFDAMVRDSRGVFGRPETCVRILKRIIEIVGTNHVGLTFHFGGLSQVECCNRCSAARSWFCRPCGEVLVNICLAREIESTNEKIRKHWRA